MKYCVKWGELEHYFPASQMVNSDIIAIAKRLRGCY